MLVKLDGESYDGEWRYDEQTGKVNEARIIVPGGGGGKYKGEFMAGLPHGQGQLEQDDGGSYTGEWTEGRRSGHGKQITVDGESYVGTWREGLQTGRGVWQNVAGARYEGEWRLGERNGEGTWTMPSKNPGGGFVSYSGHWEFGAMTGRGELTMQGSDGGAHVQSGEFRDGKIWGGAWVDDNGGILGGWRSGIFYPGRDTAGQPLKLPSIARLPARLLLSDDTDEFATALETLGTELEEEPEVEDEENDDDLDDLGPSLPQRLLRFPSLAL